MTSATVHLSLPVHLLVESKQYLHHPPDHQTWWEVHASTQVQDVFTRNIPVNKAGGCP